MRTKTLLVAAVLGAVGVATASAQVTSENVVGYVKKDLMAGISLISNPLSNGANMASEVIPSPPVGTTIYLYDGVSFTSSNFLGVWAPDVELPVGAGFYIQLGEATSITFIGDVLQGNASNKQIPMGLSIQGSLVPQAGGISTDLGFPAEVGDTVFTWDGSGFEASNYLGVWAPAEPMLGLGDAVFVDKASDAAWDRNFVVE